MYIGMEAFTKNVHLVIFTQRDEYIDKDFSWSSMDLKEAFINAP